MATLLRNDPNSHIVRVDLNNPPGAPMSSHLDFSAVVQHKTFMNSGGLSRAVYASNNLIKIIDYTPSSPVAVDQFTSAFTIGGMEGFILSEYLAVANADNSKVHLLDTNASFAT